MRTDLICGEMSEPTGALVRLVGDISGEALDMVPLAPWVDLAALTEGDAKPLEVVVAIPEGKSRRGWYYEAAALNDIATAVNTSGLPGILGHQKPDDVDTQFPAPVTHWTGAKVVAGESAGKVATLYVRGVIDPDAPQVKRWIKAKTVRQVSIYGRPKLAQVGGETRVQGYEPLSIDWTPINRNGMPTRIVALTGEMDAILKPGETPDADADKPEPKGETKPMKPDEILKALREGRITPAEIAGEMVKSGGWKPADVLIALGLKPEEVINLAAPDYAKLHGEMATAIGEIAASLGLAKDAALTDLAPKVKEVVKTAGESATKLHGEMVTRLLTEMVPDERARKLVKRMVAITGEMDEAAVKKAITDTLNDEEIKDALGEMFTETAIRPTGEQGGGGASGAGSTGAAGGTGTGTGKRDADASTVEKVLASQGLVTAGASGSGSNNGGNSNGNNGGPRRVSEADFWK